MGKGKVIKTEGTQGKEEVVASWSLWTASSYAIVMVLIGLPLWHTTTTVHRAPLPYNDMLTLHELFDISNMNSKVDTAGLPLSAAYDILITLMVPEPDVFDATWAIQQGIEEYLSPMLQKLNNFAEFTVRSQIQYYVKLNFRPVLNKQTGIHEVTFDQLSTVINPVESKLTSVVSQNPVLNFIVYVSPCFTNPTQILNDDGTFIDSNGFFVPQWGGIQVYNGPCPVNATQTQPHEVFMHGIMNTIIHQFRALLGIQYIASDLDSSEKRHSSLIESEILTLLRERLIRLQFTSANTLNSLGKLLDQITNIVVRDEVREEVERSVNALKLSYTEGQQGKLNSALEQARISYKSSETAFHHPSNLAQLYFPDDQKYAIYIPLFLPVGIPVLLSLRSIFAILKQKKL